MKPTLKIHLKPKYKIGECVWSINYGYCMADYFQNPTDDKLLCRKVIGYNIQYRKNKAVINGYFLEGGDTATDVGNWYFGSKKEIKNYLKQEAIRSYRFGTGYKPKIEKFILTNEERILLKL